MNFVVMLMLFLVVWVLSMLILIESIVLLGNWMNFFLSVLGVEFCWNRL